MTINRFAIVPGSIVALAILLFLPGETIQAQQALSDTVKIGVLAKRGVERCLSKWEPTAEYLTSKIQGHSFSIVPLDFDEIHPVVEKGEVDFILANSSFYVGLEHLYGASRIATLNNLTLGKGYTIFGGVIFCRADRKDMRHLKDTKGKTFMAVKETSLGGWQMGWRELKENGIDPHEDFTNLSFGGTHDAVVYAVRDGQVDAGTVRTDALERMAKEKKIRMEDFQVFSHSLTTQYACEFTFVHSTILYPEWPFAKVRHTSDALAKKVTVALLEMSSDDSAAKAANCVGWTIPLNYQPVHDCLKELRVAPYEDYGKITFGDMLRQYWHWITGSIILLIMIALIAFRVARLNRRLGESLTITQDEIIERKQAERKLRKSQEAWIATFDAMTDWVSLIDPNTYTIINSNKAGNELTGHPINEIIGNKCYKVIHNTNEAHPSCPIQRMLKSKRREEVETSLGEDGTCFLISVDPVFDENEEIVNIVHIVKDITKRKQAEEDHKHLEKSLFQSDKMASIGQLAAGVAHEINNPIGFIASNLNTMNKYLWKIIKHISEDDSKTPESRQKIDVMIEDFGDAITESLDGADRVTKIVADLKSFSRVDGGEVEQTDLNKGLESTLNIVWNQLKYLCKVEKEYGDIPQIKCFPNRINQVFMNLLVNAGHAIKGDSGLIRIKTWAEDDHVHVSIRDNGCGIPKEDLTKLYDPFFTTKDVGKGTGLGLSLAYDIVNKHGGTITVDSEVGKGTEFVVTLPIRGITEPASIPTI